MENSEPSSSTEKSEESQEESPPNQAQPKLDGECSNSGNTFATGIWKYQVESKVIPPPTHQEPPPPIIGFTNDIHNGILSGRSNDDQGLQATDPFPQSWFCPPQITFPEGGHVQTPTSERSYAAVVQGLDGSQAKQTKSEAAESPTQSVQLEGATDGSKPTSPEPLVDNCESTQDIVGSDKNESEELLCTITPGPWTTLSGLEWRIPISESFQLEDSSTEDGSAGLFEQQATVARNAIQEILMTMGSSLMNPANVDGLQDVSTMQSPHQWGMELGGPMFAPMTGSKGLQKSFRGLQQFHQDFGNDDNNQKDQLLPKGKQGYGSDATPQKENFPLERKQRYGNDDTSQEQNLTLESKQDYGNTSQPENLKLESEPNYEYGASNTLGECLLPQIMQDYGNGASNSLGESLLLGSVQDHGNRASNTLEESLLLGSVQDHGNRASNTLEGSLLLGSVQDHGNRASNTLEDSLLLGSVVDHGNRASNSLGESLLLGSVQDHGNRASNTLEGSLLLGSVQDHGNRASNTLEDSLLLGSVEDHGNRASNSLGESLLLGSVQDHGNRASNTLEESLLLGSVQDHGNRASKSLEEILLLGSVQDHGNRASNSLEEILLLGRIQDYGNRASNTLEESLLLGNVQDHGNRASNSLEESLLPGSKQAYENGAFGRQENLPFGINLEMELPYSRQFQQNPVYSREPNHSSMFEIDERLFVENRRVIPCVGPDQREFRLFDERQYEHNIIRSVYDVNTLDTFNPTEMCSRRLLKDSVAHWPVDLVLGSGKNMNNEHTISSVLFMNDDVMEKKPKKSEYSDLSDIKLQSLVRFISGESALERPMQFATFMGYNMNKLHMNLDTDKFMTPTFAGPFADRNYTLDPSRIEVIKPFEEYMLSELGETAEGEGNDLRRKLKFNRRKLLNFNNDLLFYIFYTFCGDALQLLAAGELYQRGWRFHKVLQVWMTPEEISFISSDGIWRTGVYKYFNHQTWSCVIDTFEVNERALEGKPEEFPDALWN